MRRVIGMDIHRTFGEVVFWEDGRLRPTGRVGMTRSALEAFGRTLSKMTKSSSKRPAMQWRWFEY
jgi:transposase